MNALVDVDLGRYFYGMGIDTLWVEAERLWWRQEHDQAEPLLRQVAETGHTDAASLLGSLYTKKGCREEAIRWTRLAARQGSYHAMNNLAELLEEAEQVEEALALYRLAAGRGDADSEEAAARLAEPLAG